MQALAFVLVLIVALIGLLMPVPKSGTTYNEAVTESYNEGLEVGTARGVMIVQQTAAEKGMGEFYEDAEGTTRFRWFQNSTTARLSTAAPQ